MPTLVSEGLEDDVVARAFDELLASCDAVACAVPPDVQADLAPRAAAAGRHLRACDGRRMQSRSTPRHPEVSGHASPVLERGSSTAHEHQRQ
ncbi:hypothetical protein [Petropleomorpha daqingensis]|uniref:Uncharacterized protein n=1 Tax=Petropleomorpha daqingensis TaxID=2026353 RepID=A0A853CLM0_9ACTN|nr:hypothetical protein [Petropleomorpha daqingensis]NYJ08061.1 hypothetical protein [Petropleomorpha daqingensis]